MLSFIIHAAFDSIQICLSISTVATSISCLIFIVIFYLSIFKVSDSLFRNIIFFDLFIMVCKSLVMFNHWILHLNSFLVQGMQNCNNQKLIMNQWDFWNKFCSAKWLGKIISVWCKILFSKTNIFTTDETRKTFLRTFIIIILTNF